MKESNQRLKGAARVHRRVGVLSARATNVSIQSVCTVLPRHFDLDLSTDDMRV